MGVKAQIAFVLEYFKLELAAAMEYRINFVMQSVGMMFNDAFWILFWFILFQSVGNIGGWTFREMLLVNAVLTTSWGFSVMAFNNWKYVALKIESSGLDYYLSLPKNVLLHLLMKTGYSGVGDFVFGLLIAAFTLSLAQWPLFIVLCFFSLLLILGWALLVGSIAFYMPHFELGARTFREGFLTLAFYPWSVYSGATKFVLLFIIPAGFVAGIPVELLNNFSWEWFGILIAFTTCFFLFSVWFFYKGLRRYESGNVMGMRG